MATLTTRDRFFGGGPVASRISWGAIFAGAVVAFAVYFLLSTFGAAIGLSIVDNVRTEGFATGAAIWMIVSMLLALFTGGWVATRCTTGETLVESILYGAIVWGIMFAFLTWLAGVGVNIGFNTMMAQSSAPAAVEPAHDIRMGVAAPGETAAPGEVTTDVTTAAWWVFLGTLVSMAAAIGGAVLGSPLRTDVTREHRVEVGSASTDVNPPI